MYVSHTRMLYTLNLYSAACQLYINKMGGEGNEIKVTVKGFCKKRRLPR